MPGLPLKAADVIAAISLTLDAQRNGNLYHGWRVGIVSYAMARDLGVEDPVMTFYAALLHDVGNVGAVQHITNYPLLMNQQLADRYVKNHPVCGSVMVGDNPHLRPIARIIRSHHEWWDGIGYPDGLRENSIPLSSQIIRIADSADLAGGFREDDIFQFVLRQMYPRTGQEWSMDIWASFLRVFTNGSIPRSITVGVELPGLMQDILRDIPSDSAINDPEILDVLFKWFGRIIDSKHASCTGHSERLVNWTEIIGQALDLSEDDLRMLRWASYVHDAGKVAIPNVILDKTGKLSKEEIEIVRSHAAITGSIFRTFSENPMFLSLADIAAHHHERFDGMGYPAGLAGKGIPWLARILAVADTYDAMTTTRAYREEMLPTQAIQRLLLNAGSQFDPEVVEVVMELFRRNSDLFKAA